MHKEPLPCIREGRIMNGLRVATDTVPSIESVTLAVVINAGSRDDPPESAGMAHFIEHALFKGTGRRSCIDIACSIEEHGGYLDAYTTKEHTCIYLRCLRRHLEPSLDLLADLVGDPSFPHEEIEREKEVVLEEISIIEDAPEEVAFEEFDLRSFPRHPLGRPILGTEESVEGIDEKAIRTFMGRHYVPGNMLLIGTGNIGHDELMRLGERYLGHLPAASGKRPERLPCTPGHYNPFTKTQRKRISQAQIVVGTAIERYDPLFFAMLVLNSMLGQGTSSLLNLELREKHALAYSAFSSLSFHDELTTLNIYAGTDAAKIATTLGLIDAIIHEGRLHAPSAKEVETAKAKLLGAQLMGLEKMTKRMGRLAQDLTYFGRPIEPAEKIAAIEAVTPDTVAHAAARLLGESRISTLIHKPSR